MEDQDVEVAKRNLARRREGVQEQHEFRFLHRDGHHVYTLVETAPILDEEGRYDGALAGVIDITERKQAEEALRESERRHRQLADNIPGAVYQFRIGPDETFSVPYMSASGAELFERPLEELMDEAPPFDDIHPDDCADFLQSIAEAAQAMRRWSHEFRTITPTGKIKWLHGSSNPRHLPDGSILWDGVLLNITARKRAEEALQESKALLAKAEQMAHLGSWEWDIEPDQFTLSEGWQRVHGCHIGQLSNEDLLPIAHPDDRARIERAFDQALKGQQPYDIEHRIIRQDDGEVRIIQAYGEVIRDAHGNPVKMYGATQDITERKRAEHALQQRNRRLAELNAIVSSLTSTLSLEQVLQRILEATPQFFSQEHSATIQLLEEDGNLHQRADSSNIPAEKQQNIFRPGEGIAGRVIQEQRPINVADVTADPDYLPGPIPPHYRSLLVVPLIAHNQPLGTLSLSSRRVEAFDDRDIERLQGLAGYAAIAVYNAQLYEQTRRDAETKDLLLREVNHRVKNNLNAIIGLLYVERRHAPPEALPAYRPIRVS
jgi:PAS domain S-box-containing protein